MESRGGGLAKGGESGGAYGAGGGLVMGGEQGAGRVRKRIARGG